MWISSIELINFKSYVRQVLTFPQPTAEKNIVLIGGMNGFGKTSLLEALYLCLYGKDAMTHLARAGLKTNDARGYPTFLERAFNGEAKRDSREFMSVKVVINKTKTKAIEITRKWYFRSNGMVLSDEETLVRDIIRDVPELPRRDGKNNFYLSQLLDNILFPVHIAPFFFFDGEEVKKLADQSRVEQVKQGLEGLLGVVLLRDLSERLKTFEHSRRASITSVDMTKLDQLATSLEENERKFLDNKQKKKEIESKLDNYKVERDSLLERVIAAGGAGSDVATVKDFVEEREQVRTELRKKQGILEDLLTTKLPFYLVSKDILDDYKRQITSELKYTAWLNEKSALEPRKSEFLKSFTDNDDCLIEPALTEGQIDAIFERIEKAWTSLFFPPPDDCASELIHTYVHEDQKKRSFGRP